MIVAVLKAFGCRKKHIYRDEIKNPKKRMLAWRRELKEHTPIGL